MIFVNVCVMGAPYRNLLEQRRNERWVPGCEESGQHAKHASRQSGVELRQDVRAPDAEFDFGSDAAIQQPDFVPTVGVAAVRESPGTMSLTLQQRRQRCLRNGKRAQSAKKS